MAGGEKHFVSVPLPSFLELKDGAFVAVLIARKVRSRAVHVARAIENHSGGGGTAIVVAGKRIKYLLLPRAASSLYEFEDSPEWFVRAAVIGCAVQISSTVECNTSPWVSSVLIVIQECVQYTFAPRVPSSREFVNRPRIRRCMKNPRLLMLCRTNRL